MSALDLGRHDRVTEVQGPRAYEVRTGQRYLHGLEDGEVRHWPEYHLFIIDERTGSVMIEGGYGTFSYGWPSVARGPESLHSFLYDLNFDYFMGKAAKQPYRIPDFDRTILEMRREIIRERREGWIAKAVAREMWDEIEEHLAGVGNETEFHHAIWDRCGKNIYERFCDGCSPLREMDHPGMRRFWDEVWSVFAETILKPHWLAHVAKTPLPRRRTLVTTHGRFDRIAA